MTPRFALQTLNSQLIYRNNRLKPLNTQELLKLRLYLKITEIFIAYPW